MTGVQQARLLALRLAGHACLACDHGRPSPCSCLVACQAAGCRLSRAEESMVPAETSDGRKLIIPAIDSAVTGEEALALAELARGKTVIELGAWLGFTTVVLASVAERVISVDWHHGDIHAGLRDTLEAFTLNLDNYGVRDRVQVVCERFDVALPRLTVERGTKWADGAFIDAQHDEASVALDLLMVLPLIRPGGFVACHDYGRSEATGNPGFAVTPVMDRFGVAGVAGTLAWGFKPGG